MRQSPARTRTRSNYPCAPPLPPPPRPPLTHLGSAALRASRIELLLKMSKGTEEEEDDDDMDRRPDDMSGKTTQLFYWWSRFPGA